MLPLSFRTLLALQQERELQVKAVADMARQTAALCEEERTGGRSPDSALPAARPRCEGGGQCAVASPDS
jgi:hypothetical protein